MALTNAPRSCSTKRACSASAGSRPAPLEGTAPWKPQGGTQNQATTTPRDRADRAPCEVRLPPITKTTQRNSGRGLWEKVCVPALLYGEEPDLAKLRLYFKGLNLKPEQINKAHPETKWTFLHHFANQGDVDLISWALKAGADHTAANAMGKTPLHLAAETNKTTAVMALLQGGANVNATTLAGYTPLHLAVLNRHKLTVRTLLANSFAPPDVYVDSIHGTPIEMSKCPEICEMLTEYTLHGCLKSPKSKRMLRLSSSMRSQRSREFSESGSAVPTPKSTRILLQPLLTRDISDQSGKVRQDMSSSDRHQLNAIQRQLSGLTSF